jgi:hypothetical protein
VINVEEEGAFAAALKVIVELQVGLQGLLRKVAVTPVGSAVRMLNVTGVVEPDVKVAVAVSTPPAAPSVIDNVEGLSARVNAKPAAGVTVTWFTIFAVCTLKDGVPESVTVMVTLNP